MGTSTLEVNLLHQVAVLREVLLHAILLELHKAYDALDRSRCLDILGGVWCRAQGPPRLPQILGEAEDGGAGGRVLLRNLPQRERSHPERLTVAHHLQFGGERGDSPRGIPGGGMGWETQ